MNNAIKAAILPLALLGLSAAQAQFSVVVPHTFVSGTGNDAATCARATPCLTFAGAYAKTAVGGEIDAIDAVDLGPIAVTHSIVLDGGGSVAGFVTGGTTGVTVNGGSGDIVTLRNLTITSANGQGTGLSIQSTGMIHIENVRISGFQTLLSATGFSSFSLNNSVLRDCAGGEGGSGVGLLLADSPSVSTVRETEILNCGTGIQETSGVSAITDTNISFNAVGVSTTGSGSLLSFERTLISGSGNAAVQAGAGTTMEFSNTTLVNNLVGIAAGPYTGSVESYGNNRVKHNGTVGNFTRNLPLR